MNKEVIIIGAGGHGRVIADIVNRSDDIVYGFLDDKGANSERNVIGKIADCEHYKDKYFIIAIGDNFIRKKIALSYPTLKYYTAVHPNSIVSDNVIVGAGTCIMANAVINDSAKIGEHCIVNTHATVEHDAAIEDFVHISPNAALCGTVHVGKCTQIGAGATVKNNIAIASNCIIGLGAAVIHDIEKSGVYIGVPAREKGVKIYNEGESRP